MKLYNDLNDYEVLYMVSENSEEAMDLIFKKYTPIVENIANKYVHMAKKVGYEKEDLKQEGFLALSSALINYNQSSALFYTYAITAIKRKMLNLIRVGMAEKYKILNESLSLDKSISDDDNSLLSMLEDKSSLNPLDEMENEELRRRIKKQLYSLSIGNASIFELKMNGFKIVEIAQLLGSNARLISLKYNKMKKRIQFNN